MSWNVQVSNVPADGTYEALTDAFDKAYPEPDEGVQEQFSDLRYIPVDYGAAAGLTWNDDKQEYDGTLDVTMSGHVPQSDNDPVARFYSVIVTRHKDAEEQAEAEQVEDEAAVTA